VLPSGSKDDEDGFSEVSDLLKDPPKALLINLIILFSQKEPQRKYLGINLLWGKYLSATSTPKRSILWAE